MMVLWICCPPLKLPYRYKQEASIEDTNEQGMEGRYAVWGGILRVLATGLRADWYLSSVLSTFMQMFRDVSSYTSAIMLAVYLYL